MSGSIHAWVHRHVGYIGCLGLDMPGEVYCWVTLGVSSGDNAAIGTILRRVFALEDVPVWIEKILATYLKTRHAGEEFLATYRRVGAKPFKEALYAAA